MTGTNTSQQSSTTQASPARTEPFAISMDRILRAGAAKSNINRSTGSDNGDASARKGGGAPTEGSSGRWSRRPPR